MKKGFTLVEMLVVIGIIAVLIGAAIGGYSSVTERAQKARDEELVHNVATALGTIFQNRGKWPKAIVDGVGKDEYRLGPDVAKALAAENLLSLSCEKDENGKVKRMTGFDKYGVLDAWGMAVMRKNSTATTSTRVPTGGEINDHVVRYSVDVAGKGYTTVNIGGRTFDVRASAVAWSCGKDGVISPYPYLSGGGGGAGANAGRAKRGGDDVYSFSRGQVKE